MTMILKQWLSRAWRTLRAPPRGAPSPRMLPAYAALGRSVSDTDALEPRLRLLVRQLAAELSGCRWCVEYGRHVWRQAFLPSHELAALPHFAAPPLLSDPDRPALPSPPPPSPPPHPPAPIPAAPPPVLP